MGGRHGSFGTKGVEFQGEELSHRLDAEAHPGLCSAPQISCSVMQKLAGWVWRRDVEAYEDSLDPIFELHRGGKIHVVNAVGLDSQRRLSSVSKPGVAEAWRAIQADPSLAYEYTIKSNSVAVVTDGRAGVGPGKLRPL